MKSFFYSIVTSVLLFLIVVGAQSLSMAAEHSWIIPGQCTPPELSNRGIVGTREPKLGEHDKIAFDLEGGQLVMEFEAVNSDSLTIGWMWIASDKIKSGSSVFLKSSSSFELTGTEDTLLKSLKFVCSFDNRERKLIFRLGLVSPRYALIPKQGEQGGPDQPPTRPEFE